MVAATADDVAMPAPGPTGAGSPAGLDISQLLGERSAQDIIAGVVRVRLGGLEYQLPVLSIAANRRWHAQLEGSLVNLVATIDLEGEDLGGILATFATATDQLLDALYAFEAAGPYPGQVLPERAALEEQATDSEVLVATLGVWSASNPFGAVALGAMRQAEASLSALPRLDDASSRPTNGAPPPTGGRRRSSSAS